MNKAIDFLGKELVISDLVVYQELGYRSFLIGKIIKITPKCVFIDRDIHNKRPEHMKRKLRQEHYQVIKMEDQGYDGYSPF